VYSPSLQCTPNLRDYLAGVRRRLRSTLHDEGGFSLVELLVVCVIVGILAAIAIPSFATQKGKALDAQAKVLARTAQTTAETIATDTSGSYEKVTAAELNKYEPRIRIVASASEAYLSAATGAKSEYSVTAKATDGNEFKISRNALGEVSRKCVSPVSKTGCGGAETGTW
jgi:prepilin-type N-terminal cleavage/methylation domain-containing protein